MLYKCHPLGMFETIGAVYFCKNMEELFEKVLIDSPLGQFFTKTDKTDFEEFPMEIIRNSFRKKYLETFYDFCNDLGGITAEVMGEILEFEADRMTLTICAQCIGKKDIPPDEKAKLFPNFGELYDIQSKLKDIENFDDILKATEKYNSFHNLLKNSDSGKNMETLFHKKFVELNKSSFHQQFNFGVFYSYVKLKEQEINNLMWIAECIKQEQKQRINDNVIF